MMKYISIIALFISLSSCDQFVFEDEKESTNPQVVFDYLWNEANEKYAYFDLKGIDWDKVYTQYSAKLYDDMPEDSLFQVLGGMLSELKDDHTNLISNFDFSSFGVENLGQDNFDWRIVKDNYLPKDLYITGPFIHEFMANKEVGYVRFSSFPGSVDNENLDFILNRYKDTKGLILDLRENGGGAVTDIFALLSRFVETKTLVNYSRTKSGPGRNEFSDAEPVYVTPATSTRYTKKITMLVDRGTYSAGSFTALATKALPNVILIGDTTGGGLGLPNGGQLPNGWTYRFSITQALTLDKSEAYENGVPPDIQALFDWTNLTKDEVIERALQEIR